jgi:septum site-determining protein MinD
VVAIDADAGLRNLDLLLGLENRVHLTAADVLAGDCRLDQALIRHRSLQGLHLLCLSKPRSKLPLAFGSKTLTWVADALRRSASPPAFILIDCPAGQTSPPPSSYNLTFASTSPCYNWFISN